MICNAWSLVGGKKIWKLRDKGAFLPATRLASATFRSSWVMESGDVRCVSLDAVRERFQPDERPLIKKCEHRSLATEPSKTWVGRVERFHLGSGSVEGGHFNS